MEASDLVVHPSHADALPTAVIQAMAAARPLVATDVGGIPELVNAQSAALVPPRQPSRLAQEMEALARDSRRRKLMGTEGKRRFEEKLAAKTWARRLAALYHDVLNDADQGVERG
jgi:glycosyltransferase involved in cell wall biosynthesis